jgi:hypothetical protein
MPSHCKSCLAPIAWEQTKKGAIVPISLATGESHFKDCIDAKTWSKSKRKPKGPVRPLGNLFEDREAPP